MKRRSAAFRRGDWRAALGVVVLAQGVISCGRTEVSGSPEELIQEGWRSYRLVEYAEARRNFAGVLRELDGLKKQGAAHGEERKLRLNALYGLGLVECFERKNSVMGEPEQYMDQVVALHPGSNEAGWAELALVRNRHIPATSSDKIDVAALKKSYGELVTKYPGKTAGEEAFVYLQTLYVQTLTQEDARTAVEAIGGYLAEHPQTRLRSALCGLRSTAHVTLAEYRAALDMAIEAVESKEVDPGNPALNNIVEYYRIGMMAECDVGDFVTARKYFQLFLSKYPTDQRAFSVRRELERMEEIERGGAGAASTEAGTGPGTATRDAATTTTSGGGVR